MFLENDRPALARFDGSTCEQSDDDTDIPQIQWTGGYVGNMTVAPDGQLWAAGGSVGRPVLGVYDGTTWTDVFTDTEDLDLLERPLQVAPDGTIWLHLSPADADLKTVVRAASRAWHPHGLTHLRLPC